jgi:hypothetical protein
MKILSQIISFLFLMSVQSAWAGPVHGVFQVVKGDVQIITQSSKAKNKAKIGSKVFPGDTIVAGKDSRAKVVMVDKNEISISPDSKVVIENYEYKPESDKKNVLLNVLYGKVRAKVEQKYDDNKNKFQVKTASAVAGVRGTDFFTSYNVKTDTTQVVTFEGTVSFGKFDGTSGVVKDVVQVRIGETTTAAGNAPPAPPVELPKSELNEMASQSDANSNERTSTGEPVTNDNKKEDKKPDNENKEPENKEPEKKQPENKEQDKKPEDKGRTVALPKGPESRMPANAPSMMISDDMPANNPDVTQGRLPIPTQFAPPIQPGPDVKCDFCNQVIETTRRTLKINATTPTSP